MIAQLVSPCLSNFQNIDSPSYIASRIVMIFDGLSIQNFWTVKSRDQRLKLTSPENQGASRYQWLTIWFVIVFKVKGYLRATIPCHLCSTVGDT